MSGGLIDLNDNDFIVDYTGASQLAAVQALINSARNGGAWTGTTGITSTAARTADPKNTTLGAMEATDYKSLYGSTATFDGQAIDNDAVLVKFTYYGDTDFNGHVNFDDYVRTDNGFNNHLMGWMNGDFDGSAAVNFDDYVLIDLGFNTQGGSLSPTGGGHWDQLPQMEHFSLAYMYYLIDQMALQGIYLTEQDFFPSGGTGPGGGTGTR
jgi:hypothetical protein